MQPRKQLVIWAASVHCWLISRTTESRYKEINTSKQTDLTKATQTVMKQNQRKTPGKYDKKLSPKFYLKSERLSPTLKYTFKNNKPFCKKSKQTKQKVCTYANRLQNN